MKAFLLGAVATLILTRAPSAVSAQTIQGRVVDEESTRPIVGAVVTLLDEAGVRLRGTLTNADGVFSIPTGDVRSTRIRIEMMGRQTVDSGLVPSGGSPFLTIPLRPNPIRLNGIDVRGSRRCSRDVTVARETLVVWDEVQKALRAESITREQVRYRFHVVRTQRVLRGGYGWPVGETTREGVRQAEDPFRTLEPRAIEREGYVRSVNGVPLIYGPNTGVLLSPGFESTHCFSLAREDDRPGQIGLVFEPVPGRRIPDIEGVLWIDETSSELRTLEFRYANLPAGLTTGTYSGRAEFERLPQGTWIIRRWQLRTPVIVEEGVVREIEQPPPQLH
jgi:hypothetical protein